MSSFFEKLKNNLTKTRDNLAGKIGELIKSSSKIDDDFYEELEEILITADVGVDTSLYIIDILRDKVKNEKISDPSLVKESLKSILIEILGNEENSVRPDKTPSVYLVIGVNGVGKTTSIGKIAAKLHDTDYKVIMAAADTFRAAAIDQLEIWSKRANVELIRQNEGSDPAAVVYDAIMASKARKNEVLICDTAGRLHNKKNLMNELEKINRVIDREYSEAYKKTYLVLDATTGQNAVSQASEFSNVCKIDGIILTKLDGTAKGGIVVSIKHKLNIPVKFIGIGEGIDDLQPFCAKDFVEALF